MATRFDQHFAGLDITQAQFRLLVAIRDNGNAGVTPSVLAEQLLIEKAPISVMTNRLVEDGLLARLPGKNRRTFNLALTERGTMLLQKIIPSANALAEETLQGFDEASLAEVRVMLETIEQTFRATSNPQSY